MKIRRYIKGDRVIWMIVLILMVISLLSVYSTTGNLAYAQRGGNTFSYLREQLTWVLLALFVIWVFHLIHYRRFSQVSLLVIYLAVPFLILTFIVGKSLNDAARWLEVPFTGLTFMPSDLAKIALIMYLAKVLSMNQEDRSKYKMVFRKIVAAIALVCGLILPANFSTALLVFLTAFSLLFVGRMPLKYLGLLVFIGVFAFGVFVGGMALLGKEGRITTWKNRVENFASGEESDNYQADQAKVAIVQGGLFGKGPGKSTQRNLLPHPYSDFIYAVIIEEYGSIIGGLLVLALYLWLFFRAGLIVRRSQSVYGALLAFGLSFGLVLQAFVNMGVAVGLMPVTGQTLPLVSKGGSSLFFTGISLGMLLSLSWSTKEGAVDRISFEDDEGEDGQGADGQGADSQGADSQGADSQMADSQAGKQSGEAVNNASEEIAVAALGGKAGPKAPAGRAGASGASETIEIEIDGRE